MSKIKIHNEGVSKFVLLEELETGELWVVTDKNAEFHEEVYKRFARKEGKTFRCLGGGRMSVNESEIKCWGYSVDYGKPDAESVEKVLTENITDKKVVIEIGVGY
jgi:hypothetical protein